MASRTKTLAAAIVSAIQAFSGLPAGVDCRVVRNVRHLVNDLPTDVTATIAVICSDVADESTKGDYSDSATIGVVVLANCNGDDIASTDQWDELTEKLRDHFKTSTALKTVTVATGISAQRKKVETPVVCDADVLDQHEVFISVTTLEYLISVGNRS